MATYTELRAAFGNDDMRHRLEVAICIKAVAVLAEESPSASRSAWAAAAFSGTSAESDRMMKYLLALNAGLTVGQIAGVTDAGLQTAVNSAIDVLYP